MLRVGLSNGEHTSLSATSHRKHRVENASENMTDVTAYDVRSSEEIQRGVRIIWEKEGGLEV